MISRADAGKDTLLDVLQGDRQGRTGREAQSDLDRTNAAKFWGDAYVGNPDPPLMFPSVRDNASAEEWQDAEKKLFELQPDLAPFNDELGRKLTEVIQARPGISNNEAVEFAVCFVRKEHGLPLHGARPKPNIINHVEVEQLRGDIERQEVQRLEGELKNTLAKMKENPGAYTGDISEYRSYGVPAPEAKYKGDGQDPIGAAVGIPQPKPVPSGGKRK